MCNVKYGEESSCHLTKICKIHPKITGENMTRYNKDISWFKGKILTDVTRCTLPTTGLNQLARPRFCWFTTQWLFTPKQLNNEKWVDIFNLNSGANHGAEYFMGRHSKSRLQSSGTVRQCGLVHTLRSRGKCCLHIQGGRRRVCPINLHADIH